jgi:hypothetical protein
MWRPCPNASGGAPAIPGSPCLTAGTSMPRSIPPTALGTHNPAPYAGTGATLLYLCATPLHDGVSDAVVR